MKRLFAVLLFALLAAAPVRAEIVGQTQGDYIHRYTADNGQEIYYLSSAEETHVRAEDVSFDGHDDLVMLTADGASNAFYTFFLWDGAQYALADLGSAWESGLPNYALHPEKGLVSAHSNDGYAGLLHKEIIFRWDGTRLREVRRAVSDLSTTTIDEGDVTVTVRDNSRISMRVTEPTYDAEGYRDGDALLWSFDAALGDLPDEQALLDEEREALWQGL